MQRVERAKMEECTGNLSLLPTDIEIRDRPAAIQRRTRKVVMLAYGMSFQLLTWRKMPSEFFEARNLPQEGTTEIQGIENLSS